MIATGRAWRRCQPYAYYGNGEIIHTTYPSPDFIGAAAGLLSTVRDMAKYDIATDRSASRPFVMPSVMKKR